jgi:hypothetical protein
LLDSNGKSLQGNVFFLLSAPKLTSKPVTKCICSSTWKEFESRVICESWMSVLSKMGIEFFLKYH